MSFRSVATTAYARNGKAGGSVVSVTPNVPMVKNGANGQELTMRLSPTTGYEKAGQPAAAGDREPGPVRVEYRVEPDRSLNVQQVEIDRRRPVSFQLQGGIVAKRVVTR